MNSAEQTMQTAQDEVTQPVPAFTPLQEATYRDMIAAGVPTGRKKSAANPKMDNYVFSYVRGVAVLDVEQTIAAIAKAGAFLKRLGEEKRTVLVLGSQPAARDFVKDFAERHGFFYVVTRWLGGTLTNFKTIMERITYFKKLKADKASGALDKYTKKENVVFDRMIANLTYSFSGMEDMATLPAALVVVDAGAHDIAVREARRAGVPVVAIMSNDNDPAGIAYPIPANDNARSSLAWVFARLEEAMK